MKKHLILLFALATITGCATWRKPKRTVQPIPLLQKVTVNNRLVPVYIPPDSATLKALFECDSMNNVRVKEITELKGSMTDTDLSFENNELRYRAKTNRPPTLVPVRDSIIDREVPVEVLVPYEVNVLTGWQWFQIWLGRIFGLLLVIFLGSKFVKFYLKLP